MVDLSNFETMDSTILLGIVNEKLRIECDDLYDLSASYGLETDKLADKLRGIGYHYDSRTNQFKSA